MQHPISISTKIKFPKLSKAKLLPFLLLFIIGLAVFQDYLFSIFKNTGFYLSESLLYNSFWLFFIPLFLISSLLLHSIFSKNNFLRIIYTLGIGVVFSLLHLFLSACFFVFVSSFVFEPAHRFSTIFNSMLSNQFYLAFLFYTIAPYYYYSSFKNASQEMSVSKSQYSDKINLKTGSKTQLIKSASIQIISTDRPYSVVLTSEQKFLSDKSLKDFEIELDPSLFFRVHRSSIVHEKFIKELKSRKNGDYDALLENGQWVRFSRHYRKNWSKLLH